MFQKLVFVVLACLLNFSQAHAEDLKTQGYGRLGDAPPKLLVNQWVQGEPVTTFKKGHIYVVEFWSTACGPCVDSIPHLNKIQAKYKDRVTIIGVDVREMGATIEQRLENLKYFLKSHPVPIEYRIAFDGENKMIESWMDLYVERGIPVAFIIDENSKVAAVAHSQRVDDFLEKMVAGKWEGSAEQKAYQERFAVEKEKERRFDNALKAVNKLMEEKKWHEAINVMDVNSDVAEFYFQKFDILLNELHLPDEAFKYTGERVSINWDHPFSLLNILEKFYNSGGRLKDKNLDFMVDVAKRVEEILPAQFTDQAPEHFFKTLIKIYNDAGLISKAEALQAKIDAKKPKDGGPLQKKSSKSSRAPSPCRGGLAGL